MIDFERSEDGPAVRDFVRLPDAWDGRPDLYEAVTDGYDRPLTPAKWSTWPSSRCWTQSPAFSTAWPMAIWSSLSEAVASWPGCAPRAVREHHTAHRIRAVEE
ncbi:hypothetical protein [Streptomyces mirabilis]|uniref:hypothetical protein n=1 Tax=Streptomyces mirabilis TaxID=68239 RepID=UPI00367A71D0